ncbi:hypothetical protein EV127DRAFT_213712 [Xylaria flabelliformis]|nr:hypothetical protein EV127DRAFT_213712 [Xylaria flabelliformis]
MNYITAELWRPGQAALDTSVTLVLTALRVSVIKRLMSMVINAYSEKLRAVEVLCSVFLVKVVILHIASYPFAFMAEQGLLFEAGVYRTGLQRCFRPVSGQVMFFFFRLCCDALAGEQWALGGMEDG